MSREIRRLHRKENSFTNFSSSQSTESTQLNLTDTDSKPPRRQRRRRQDDSEANPSSTSSLPDTPQSGEQLIDDDPQITASSFSTPQKNNVSSIRAELLEDTHHRELAQSDFSDDSHDWGGDSHSLSDDYWHFLGSFE